MTPRPSPSAASAPNPPRGDARTRILDVALRAFRTKGYAATTVDDLCRAAGVTKGAFFHHFATKEESALGAIEHWDALTGHLFETAPYWQVDEPRARLLAYLDFRASLICGEVPEFTCLLGTLVQETFASHPALQQACGRSIEAHATTLVSTIEAARAYHAPGAEWSALGLGLYLQAGIQGGFVLAKAMNDRRAALDVIEHLKRHVENLLPLQDRTCEPPSILGPIEGHRSPLEENEKTL